MYNDDPLTWGLNESDLESSSDENTVKNDILEKNVAKTGNAIDENPSPVISEEKLDCQAPSLASNDCLPGVSPDMWRKFKELQKKNQEMRRKTQHRERRRRAKRHQKTDDSGSSSREENRERQAEREAHWNGLTQYFGVNDRFEAPACSRPQPETGLEKNLDCAIAEGDYGKADDLSDRLATRELAVKIAGAIDCRDFVETRQQAEASREAQKRKNQVAWGFEAKQRWETKSNMGFM
ncbi:hypothetical protein SKAU_G00165570 [Synaphobranchus kaupii]|uniref:Protein FAM204A n=1 Tax=Synaphobranchus kaupii TaxID=118154 RepID=A0A9Q1J0B2_SYNKA|nr:hypothetical protein SKAU_G00165570 [Synaphobranchus kaupii]